MQRLSGAARVAYERAYVHALTPVFRVAAGVALFGFVVSWLLPEHPLRATAATSRGLEDSLAAPKAPDSLAEIERALALCTSREDRMRFHRAVAQRAGVDLSPGATWARAPARPRRARACPRSASRPYWPSCASAA